MLNYPFKDRYKIKKYIFKVLQNKFWIFFIMTEFTFWWAVSLEEQVLISSRYASKLFYMKTLRETHNSLLGRDRLTTDCSIMFYTWASNSNLTIGQTSLVSEFSAVFFFANFYLFKWVDDLFALQGANNVHLWIIC